jgi:ribosomal protein S27AE
MATRQPRPKARCPACGTVSIYAEHINRRCVKILDPDSEPPTYCDGVFRGATGAENWTECPACHATGARDDATCPRCGGDGWLYNGPSAAALHAVGPSATRGR